jgi:hypothetical protein
MKVPCSPVIHPSTTVLGMQNYNGIQAPGFNFIAGIQDPNFPLKAFNQGWLTRDSLLNTPLHDEYIRSFKPQSTLLNHSKVLK